MPPTSHPAPVPAGRSRRTTKAAARPAGTALQLLEESFRIAAEAANPIRTKQHDRVQTSRRPPDEGAPTRHYRLLIDKYEKRTLTMALDMLDEINGINLTKTQRNKGRRCRHRDCPGYGKRQHPAAPSCSWCNQPLKDNQ